MTDDKNKAGPEPLKNVSADEFKAAFDTPSVFVNKVVLTLSGPLARLTFFERREEHGQLISAPRTSITMPLGDLMEIKDLLNELATKVKVVQLPSSDKKDG